MTESDRGPVDTARSGVKASVRYLFALLCVLFMAVLGSSNADAATLAVLPFQNRSPSGEWEWLSIGLADMVGTDLAESPELDVVERERIAVLLREMEETQLGLFDRTTAAKVGEAALVELVLFGSFEKQGNQLEIEALIVDVATGKLRRAETASGRANDVFGLADSLALQILENLNIELSEEERAAIQRVSTKSLDAAQRYYEGLALHDGGRYPASLAAFREAASTDPKYVEARDRVARTYEELDEPHHAALEYSMLVQEFPEHESEARWWMTLALLQRNELGLPNAAIRSASRTVQCFPGLDSPSRLMEHFPDEGRPHGFWVIRVARRPVHDRRFRPYVEALEMLREVFLEMGDMERALWAASCLDMYDWVRGQRDSYGPYSKDTQTIYARLIQERGTSSWPVPGSVVVEPGVCTIGYDATQHTRFTFPAPIPLQSEHALVVAPKGYEFESCSAVSCIRREDLPKVYGVCPVFGLLRNGERYRFRSAHFINKYSPDSEGELTVPQGTIGIVYKNYGAANYWEMTFNVIPAGAPRFATSERHLKGEVQARIRPFESWVTLRSGGKVHYDWCNHEGEIHEWDLNPGSYTLEVSHEGLPLRKEHFVLQPRERKLLAVDLASPWQEAYVSLPPARYVNLIEAGRRKYCMTYESEIQGSNDIYITYSSDLENWSEPERLPFCTQAPEFESSLLWDEEGWYWISFRREEEGKADRFWYACHSRDLKTWSDPVLIYRDLEEGPERSGMEFVGGPEHEFWRGKRPYRAQQIPLTDPGGDRDQKDPLTFPYMEIPLPRENSAVRVLVGHSRVHYALRRKDGSWTMPEVFIGYLEDRDTPPGIVVGPRGYPCVLASGSDGRVDLYRFNPDKFDLAIGKGQVDTITLEKVIPIGGQWQLQYLDGWLWGANLYGTWMKCHLDEGWYVERTPSKVSQSYDPDGSRFSHPVPDSFLPPCSRDPNIRMTVSDGRMYFATGVGALWVYDSRTRQSSSYNSTKYFSSKRVTEVEAAEGLIWIGTDKGVWTFDPQTEEFNSLGPPDYLAPFITAILVRPDKVYVGTLKGGLLVYDRTAKTWDELFYVGPPDGPLRAETYHLHWIDDSLWRNSNCGLEICRDGKWQVVVFGGDFSFMNSFFDGEYFWIVGNSGTFTVDTETATAVEASFTAQQANTNPNIHTSVFVKGDEVILVSWNTWWRGSRKEILEQRAQLLERGERLWQMSPEMQKRHLSGYTLPAAKTRMSERGEAVP